MTADPGVLSRIADISQSDALACLGPPARPLRLRRAWPGSPTRLILEYTAGDDIIAGFWSSDSAAARRAAATADDRLSLVEVHGELVTLLDKGTDGRLPGLAPALELPGARLISHRAERRATVAIPGAFLKLVKPGRVAAVAARHRAVHALAVPPILSEDEDAGALTLGAISGSSLHDLWAQPGAQAAVRTTGAAIRRLHAQPLPTEDCRHVHGPQQEATLLADWLERLLPHDPLTHARICKRARHALADLTALPASTPTLIHRDLHDKQILLATDGSVALIDLDTVTIGDPAIDLANLAAHFDLRARQTGADPAIASALRDSLLEGYGAPAAWQPRLEVYEHAALLRLACVYAFRPRWATTAASLAEEGRRPS